MLYKIRHHKGHGIHSPFVFNFITKVIEEKDPYYAYDDISGFLETLHFPVDEDNKVNKLSFKTANHFNAKKILELGSGEGINTLYITSVSLNSESVCVETDPEKREKAQELYNKWNREIYLTSEEFPKLDFFPDCIFLNLRNYNADKERFIPYLLSHVNENSFIFIDGIRTNRKQQMLWKQLIRHEEVILSLDLFHVGILFFDKRFYKRNYKLSF